MPIFDIKIVCTASEWVRACIRNVFAGLFLLLFCVSFLLSFCGSECVWLAFLSHVGRCSIQFFSVLFLILCIVPYFATFLITYAWISFWLLLKFFGLFCRRHHHCGVLSPFCFDRGCARAHTKCIRYVVTVFFSVVLLSSLALTSLQSFRAAIKTRTTERN